MTRKTTGEIITNSAHRAQNRSQSNILEVRNYGVTSKVTSGGGATTSAQSGPIMSAKVAGPCIASPANVGVLNPTVPPFTNGSMYTVEDILNRQPGK